MDALVIGQVVPQLAASFDRFWNSEHVWPIADIVKGDGGRGPTAENFDSWTEMSAPTPPLVLPPSDLLGCGLISGKFNDERIGLAWGDARAIADPPSKPLTMTAE